MEAGGQKKKYSIETFKAQHNANPIIKDITQEKASMSCICSQKTLQSQECFKCKKRVHICLAASKNRGEDYQCASCLNKCLDPLFKVDKVLLQSYFKTHSIFQYHQIFNFQFYVPAKNQRQFVEIRGMVPELTVLTWPMQGCFYLNDQKTPFHDLKPLTLNSNRKTRRQQYFTVPKDRLKIGLNIIRFKIPCLSKAKFTGKYQFQQKKIYFFSVNIAQLQTQIFKDRKIVQKQSIKRWMKKNSSEDCQVDANKLNLRCPYTSERIKVPVRGRYCDHFSCVCLKTLLLTHTASRYWSCPMCDCKLNQLYVDMWIYRMLNDCPKGSEVLIKNDGTYEWIQNKMDEIELDSQQKSETPWQANKNQQKKSQMIAQQGIALINVQAKQHISINVNQLKLSSISDVKGSLVTNKQKICVIDIQEQQPQRIILPNSAISSKQIKQLQITNNKVLQNFEIKKEKIHLEKQKDIIDIELLDDIIQLPEEKNKSKTNQLLNKSKAKTIDYSRKLKQKSKTIQQYSQIMTQKRQKNEIKQIVAFQNTFNAMQTRKDVIRDLPIKQMNQMKIQEFRKKYFKDKPNPLKKYIVSQELKRLYKDFY